MIEVELVTVAMVEDGDGSVIVLREVAGERVLVVGIGMLEASAIALELEEISPPRPMTHDLLLSIISRMRGRVERVLIHDLRDDVFVGQVDLMTEDGIVEVDGRPSDCVAIAVRARAPILVSDEVMDTAGFVPEDGEWTGTGDAEEADEE